MVSKSSSGVLVFRKYEIEVRLSCYFIVLDAHKVAEIRARKSNSAVKHQQQRTRILERHRLRLPTSVRVLPSKTIVFLRDYRNCNIACQESE